ncbi:MAG TPA: flagellar basal body P-ring protein FlgI [Acidobacteriaceae bacterium]|nr:flagellar basal body P-ring protein FlgI [Acidobacteriaceae bacterium]
MLKTSKMRWVKGASCGLVLSLALAPMAPSAAADNPNRHVLIRDITTVEGVRDNMLVGYGLVAGLTQTGDSQQTYFTVQTLANAMQKMGVLIPSGTVEVRNVAAVFITASLPPFARPGAKIDVTVSSVGDAKSLQGGVLLMAALHGPDGQVYAEAQGPLVIGGYSAGNGLNGKTVNTPTVGLVPNGGMVERNAAVDLHEFKTVSLLLRNPDFTTAKEVADAVNGSFGRTVASALDSNRVDVDVAQSGINSVPDLISRVQNLSLVVHTPARIIVNERTGTIVLGGDVKLTPVSVIHGNLSIQVVTTFEPAPVPGGVPVTDGKGGYRGNAPAATLVPEQNVSVTDAPAQTMRLDAGANVEELVNGLHAIGATSRDVVAILQAIQQEGGLQADLEVQ